jgi:hypothetical protein
MSVTGRFSTSLTLVLGLALSACTDQPSNAGIGLVDSQAGVPQEIIQEATLFVNGTDADVTGGEGTTGALRTLAGRVDDPSLGIIDVKGYIDFIPLTAFSDKFKSTPISFVDLTLVSDYVYGDTLLPLSLRLFDLSSEWKAIGTPADTTIATGAAVSEASFFPKSNTIRFEFSPEWIAANGPDLQSDDPITTFHGFQLDYVDGNSVAGFALPGSIMRVAVPGDTVSFQVTRVLSTITRQELPVPAGYILLQDGARPRVNLNFGLDEVLAQANAVHRFSVALTTGTPELITPSGFVRGTLSTLTLAVVTTEDDVRLGIATSIADDEGRFSFENNIMNTVIQNVLLGKAELKRFELLAPVANNTLDLVFLDDASGSSGPRAIVTVTAVN